MSKYLKWTLGILFAVLLFVVPLAAYRGARLFTQGWEITELGDGSLLPDFIFRPPTDTPDSTLVTSTEPDGQEPAVDPLENYAVWDGSERVTVLIMGLDYRDWEAGETAPRTDTMILLTIDPLSSTAGMLSIPRDLYVSIPGFQYDRINTAYRQGEVYQIPGGGPALAIQTVEQLIGVPIDFYAQVDFTTFERMIDEIGGLKIEVMEPIEVDPIGPGNHKFLKPGVQTLPGPVALAYARARNTEGGDFDRARRQQQVVLAIRERILSFDLIPILLAKSGPLYNELSSGVDTNMTIEQAIALGLLAKDIPLENIQRGIIGEEHIIFYTTTDGDHVLKPLPDKIREVRNAVFGTTDLTSPLASTPLQEKVQAENAQVAVLNAAFVEGVAVRTVEYLNTVGFNLSTENAQTSNEAFTYTTIIDYTGNPYTVQLLVDTFQISYNQVLMRYDPSSEIDVGLDMGADWNRYVP